MENEQLALRITGLEKDSGWHDEQFKMQDAAIERLTNEISRTRHDLRDKIDTLERFRDKFLGFALGITAANAVVTYLITKAVK